LCTGAAPFASAQPDRRAVVLCDLVLRHLHRGRGRRDVGARWVTPGQSDRREVLGEQRLRGGGAEKDRLAEDGDHRTHRARHVHDGDIAVLGHSHLVACGAVVQVGDSDPHQGARSPGTGQCEGDRRVRLRDELETRRMLGHSDTVRTLGLHP